MISAFLGNRNVVQNALKTSKMLFPHNDSEYTIEELKAKAGNLKCVYIENIPFCKKSYTSNVWIFDFEIEENEVLFYTPKCHKMEKAIIVFAHESAYIILVEMKSTLKGSGNEGIGPAGIEAKIKESLSKIAIFATPFVFKDNHDHIKALHFHAIIVYNNEHVIQDAITDKKVVGYSLYQPFINSKSGRSSLINTRSSIGNNVDIHMHFLHNNTQNKEEYTIDLTSLINDQPFISAKTHLFTCP